jgi:hypothetical protein
MRIGLNPNKDQKITTSDCLHQVVVPVYIPNLEGYFKDGLTILKYCLESLLKTSHSQTYFTIINNGSCIEVIEYLVSLKHNQQIHELINTTNIGKLNAVLKGLVGHSFPLITIADSDVLFLSGWQKATYAVFEGFPKTGAVCPTPSSRSYKTYTSNIYWDLFWSKQLRFSQVQNPSALKAFATSVGDENFYNENQLKQYLTVNNGAFKAVVGAGHFVATYRLDVFKEGIPLYSKFKMGGTSETELLDIPVVKKDLWRLSTADNFAFHMGNVAEGWMNIEIEKLVISRDLVTTFPKLYFQESFKINYWIKTVFFSKIIFTKKLLNYFFKFKGMTIEIAHLYTNK